MTENWWAYVQRIAAHATSVDIADKSGLTPSAITRWKQGDVPRAENAIAFARAYNRPPKEALVVAGYLDAVEADATIDHLRLVTNKQNSEHASGPSSNNKSGALGVSWHKGARKWQAHVWDNRKSIYLGLFDTVEEASAATIAKRLELARHVL